MLVINKNSYFYVCLRDAKKDHNKSFFYSSGLRCQRLQRDWRHPRGRVQDGNLRHQEQEDEDGQGLRSSRATSTRSWRSAQRAPLGPCSRNSPTTGCAAAVRRPLLSSRSSRKTMMRSLSSTMLTGAPTGRSRSGTRMSRPRDQER